MVTNLITKAVGKSLQKSNIDQSLVPFLRSITNMLLKVLVAITGMIGIQMTSFVAIIGAAGLAVDWPYQERFRILPRCRYFNFKTL
jgi:small conductance mechanosensitive channel